MWADFPQWDLKTAKRFRRESCVKERQAESVGAHIHTHTYKETCCCLSTGIGKELSLAQSAMNLDSTFTLEPDKLYSLSLYLVRSWQTVQFDKLYSLSAQKLDWEMGDHLSKVCVDNYNVVQIRFRRFQLPRGSPADKPELPLPAGSLNIQYIYLSVQDLAMHSIWTLMPERQRKINETRQWFTFSTITGLNFLSQRYCWEFRN